jgi:hypothetical protein
LQVLVNGNEIVNYYWSADRNTSVSASAESYVDIYTRVSADSPSQDECDRFSYLSTAAPAKNAAATACLSGVVVVATALCAALLL